MWDYFRFCTIEYRYNGALVQHSFYVYCSYIQFLIEAVNFHFFGTTMPVLQLDAKLLKLFDFSFFESS